MDRSALAAESESIVRCSEPMRIGKHEWRLTQYHDRSCGLLIGYEWRPLQTALNTHPCDWRRDRDWPRYNSHDGKYWGLPRTLRELWRRCPWAQGERPSNAAAALREDHVARASPNESAYCPVALALREATGEPWVIFRAVGGDFYASENGDDDPRYTLDFGLNEIIARFDEEAVCPTGTLYVDRTTNHIGFLPNPRSTPTGTPVDQSTQEID